MEYIEKLKLVTQNLDKCNRVTKHSTPEENQADTLANAFIDIEDSITKVKELINNLYLKNLDEDQVDDIILEIGEEFRHLLYHINDTRVYDYLKQE